jgi:hypothetical protein
MEGAARSSEECVPKKSSKISAEIFLSNLEECTEVFPLVSAVRDRTRGHVEVTARRKLLFVLQVS